MRAALDYLVPGDFERLPEFVSVFNSRRDAERRLELSSAAGSTSRAVFGATSCGSARYRSGNIVLRFSIFGRSKARM